MSQADQEWVKTEGGCSFQAGKVTVKLRWKDENESSCILLSAGKGFLACVKGLGCIFNIGRRCQGPGGGDDGV